MRNLTEKEKQEREEISNLMMRARTLEDVQNARRRLLDWLKRHPDDARLLGEGEGLRMIEAALRIKRGG